MSDVFPGSPDDVYFYLRKYTVRLQKHTVTAEFDYGFLTSTTVLNRAHNHAAIELIAVSSGECCIRTQDSTYKCGRNSVLLIPCGVYHSNVKTAAPPERYSFRIYMENTPEKDSFTPLYERLTSMDQPLQLEIPALIPIITAMHGELLRPGAASGDMIEALLAQCFIILLRNIAAENRDTEAETPSRRKTLTEDRSKRIDRFFSLRYAEAVTLQDLADYIYTSPTQTNRILLSRYGCSFREKLRETRLNQAIFLLEMTTLSAGEIAQQIGYKSPPSFFEAFRKAFGMTPGEYRRAKNQK